MNKVVKAVLGTIKVEELEAKRTPCWPELLHRVMEVLNKKRSKGRHEVSAYKAVFGQTLEDKALVSTANLRRCTTVADRIALVSTPGFDEFASREYILDAGKGRNNDAMTQKTEELKEGNAAYWREADDDTDKEDDEMAEAEVVQENEVQQEVVQVELQDVVETDVVNLDNKEEDEELQAQEEVPTEKVKEISIIELHMSSQSSVSVSLPTNDNILFRPPSYMSKFEWSGEPSTKFKFCYPFLRCKQCLVTGSHIIKVGDKTYLKALATSSMWFETDFISGLAALGTHHAHNPDIMFVHCLTPKAILASSECRALPPNVKKILSVLHSRSHFTVMTIDLSSNVIKIADGF